MRELPNKTHPTALPYGSPWRDTVVVICATAAAFLLSVRFNLDERLTALTRRQERLQLDEIPIGIIVLLVCLTWFAWRRYQQARRELYARKAAETQVAAALEENRKLSRETLRMVEEERRRLALELHDELGQHLNVIKLDAVAVRESADDADAALSETIENSEAIIRGVDHVYEVLRRIIARLRPVGLDELGLAAALEHCLDQWRQRLPRARFQLRVNGECDGLGETVNLTVYRVVQEGLTNAGKHAQASRVQVVLERRESPARGDELCVTVTDDGRGMASDTLVAGHGLAGMRERVEMAGGEFSLQSAPGRGLTLVARIPLDRAGAA